MKILNHTVCRNWRNKGEEKRKQNDKGKSKRNGEGKRRPGDRGNSKRRRGGRRKLGDKLK